MMVAHAGNRNAFLSRTMLIERGWTSRRSPTTDIHLIATRNARELMRDTFAANSGAARGDSISDKGRAATFGPFSYTDVMRHLLAILLLSTSAQATEIPLKSIYATMPENGMRRATVARKAGEFTESYGPALNRIQGALRGGSSNVFLVDADSIDGAITASGRILLGYGAADVPAKAEGRTGEYWLVARLGTGPARNWIVDSATLEGSQIRVRYHKRKLEFPTLDANHYLYWVPLGKLKPGAYQLELFDGKDVSLMRRVEVQPK